MYKPNQKKNAPWWNKLISKLAMKKKKKWDLYKKEKTDSRYNEYKEALNEFNFEKKMAIKKYELRKVKDKKTTNTTRTATNTFQRRTNIG